MRLDDDAVVVITGGASGLGLATAQRFAEQQDCSLVVADREAAGKAVADELGPKATFVQTDVTSERDVVDLFAAAADGGTLRAVVHCAGIAPPGRLLGKRGPMPRENFENVVNVNLVGAFTVIRESARHMHENSVVDGERGVIVCTASVAAFEGQIGQVAYAASKAGVVGMTLASARDLADARIRVASIAPGIFETPMVAGLPAEAQASLAEQVPHPRRLGRPSEFAGLAEHIVSNPMLNGEVIRLDGAIRMAPR